MKLLLALFGLLFAPGVIHCQTHEAYAEGIIRGMINSGGYDGGADKLLDRIGDAAAVSVTKVLADKKPSTSEINMVLTIIHLSFSAPQIIDNVADREPRTTSFVLQYLNSSTTDQKLKQRIIEERTFVLDQFAKSKKAN